MAEERRLVLRSCFKDAALPNKTKSSRRKVKRVVQQANRVGARASFVLPLDHDDDGDELNVNVLHDGVDGAVCVFQGHDGMNAREYSVRGSLLRWHGVDSNIR